MRTAFIIDTLTSVNICEIVKIGGKVIEIFEAVIYRENFIVSPFRNVIDKIFAPRQKYKDLMQILVKFLMNILYGESIRKDIENFACKSEYWMMTEYDEKVKEYWKISHGNYIVKVEDDKGLKMNLKIEYLATPLR